MPIREKLESLNMTLLSRNYTGVNEKNLLIKCLKCGDEYLSSHYRIKRMVTCRNCSENRTFTLNDLKNIAIENNITLVSKEYIPQTKVNWKCQKGHIWAAYPTTIKGTKTRKGTNLEKTLILTT
jgi:DNA-directed RNA polymerase subunit RPC12/RpoP